jgi:hypothetical protein
LLIFAWAMPARMEIDDARRRSACHIGHGPSAVSDSEEDVVFVVVQNDDRAVTGLLVPIGHAGIAYIAINRDGWHSCIQRQSFDLDHERAA